MFTWHPLWNLEVICAHCLKFKKYRGVTIRRADDLLEPWLLSDCQPCLPQGTWYAANHHGSLEGAPSGAPSLLRVGVRGGGDSWGLRAA